MHVYDYIEDTYVSSPGNDYLDNELNSQGITNLYDFQTGELGGTIGYLKKLVELDIISPDERISLHNATWTLLDVRRNVNAHTFHQLIVSGSLCGDLEKVYLPAINLLIDIYHRPSP